MTQELKQAIELLQYSTQELVSFLEEKAIENPLIQLEHTNVKYIDLGSDGFKKENHTKMSATINNGLIKSLSHLSIYKTIYLCSFL